MTLLTALLFHCGSSVILYSVSLSDHFHGMNLTLSCKPCRPLPPAEKAVAYMESADQIDLQGPVEPKGITCQSLYHYVSTINSSPRNIGKDGKFQLLVCLGARLVHQNPAVGINIPNKNHSKDKNNYMTFSVLWIYTLIHVFIAI